MRLSSFRGETQHEILPKVLVITTKLYVNNSHKLGTSKERNSKQGHEFHSFKLFYFGPNFIQSYHTSKLSLIRDAEETEKGGNESGTDTHP